MRRTTPQREPPPGHAQRPQSAGVRLALLLLAALVPGGRGAEPEAPPTNQTQPAAGPWRPRSAPIAPAVLTMPAAPPLAVSQPTTPEKNGEAPWTPLKIVPASAPLEPDAPPLLPPPRPLTPNVDPAAPPDEDRAVLLGAARNAVRQRNWNQALARFQDYFKRYGDDFDVRKEYAGVLVQAGRLREALAEFRRLAAQKPDDRDVLVSLADAAVQAREYAVAVSALVRVLQRTPDDRDAAVKLARAYVFDGDFAYASKVYDDHLADVRPGDAKAPRRLPDLLIDLERPADALPFLAARIEQQPNDAETLATLARAYARLGDQPKALETFQLLAQRAPQASASRQELGDALYSSENYELAGVAYSQILQVEPNNGFARLGLARVQMKQFQPKEALALLDQVPPDPAYQRSAALARAEYHQLVGEYLEAKQIYQTFLRRDGEDYDVRLSLGQLEEFIREDEKAKAEYGKIPLDARQARTARVGIASTLTAQRRFEEAADVCRRLLQDKPDDGAAMGQLVRTLGKAGRTVEAEAEARAFLADEARDELACLTVRLALGKVLRDARKFQQAAEEYELALTRPPGRIPESYYGLARSLEGMGDPRKAREILGEVIDPICADARDRLLLSDLFAADFDDGAALEQAQGVLKFEPDNLAALIRLADAEGRLDRQTGNVGDAVETAKALLAQSPTNVRGRLTLARALATHQDYLAAADAYAPLIAADPDFLVPRREQARVLYSANNYDAGAAAYAAMLTPSADESLRTDLAALARRDARAALAFGPCLASGLGGEMLTGEAAKAAAALDPENAAALQRLRLDYQARRTEQEGSRLEGDFKDDSWRHYEAIPIGENLIDLEPSNTSALFDLGQEFSTLRETRNAIDAYSQDVSIDPSEYEAETALERAGWELRPQATAGVDFFQERGFDGVSHIQRTFYRTGVRLPFGDEDEFFSLGFARANIVPKDDRPLPGNILSAGFQDKFCCEDRLLVYGLANLETFRDRVRDRVTFDTGARYAFCDLVTGRAGLFLENAEENGEALRQDIHRFGAKAGADFQPARIWNFGGTGLFYHYSDDNDAVELRLNNDVELLPPPCQLKAVLTADLLSYRSQTVLQGAPPDFLSGTIHPYFAPDFYGYYEARLEWKQWLSRDYFAHSNQCWYSLQYGIGWDDHFNNYNTVRVLAADDVRPWLTFSADAQVILSPVYEAVQATAYVVVRFP